MKTFSIIIAPTLINRLTNFNSLYIGSNHYGDEHRGALFLLKRAEVLSQVEV